jgi:hypothetical protein
LTFRDFSACFSDLSPSVRADGHDPRSSPAVKSSKAAVVARVHKIPEVVFEDAEWQKLTWFGGLVIYQSLFDRLDLKAKLRRCFAHKKAAPIYGLHRIVLIMILNAIWGCLLLT